MEVVYCFKFNRIYINFLSIVISIIIVSVFSMIKSKITNSFNSYVNTNIINEIQFEDTNIIEINQNNISENSAEDLNNANETKLDWYLRIPKINLYARN